MNHVKIQVDIMKWNENNRIGRRNKIIFNGYQQDDENTFIVYNGVAIFIIPNNLVFLDLNKIFDGKQMNVKKIIDYSKADKLSNSYLSKSIEKRKLRIYYNHDQTIYVDNDLFKYFDEEIEEKGTTNKEPIFIFEYNQLIGVLLPTVVKEW